MNHEEDFSELRELLRRKAAEQQPSPDYFDRFLSEFQRRQRAELLHRSAHSIFFERMATYFSGLGGQRWILGAGAAYAAVMLALFAWPEAREAPALAGAESDGAEGESILWDGDVSLVQPVRFQGEAGGSSLFLKPAIPVDAPAVEARPRSRRPVLPPGEMLRHLSNSSVVPAATEL